MASAAHAPVVYGNYGFCRTPAAPVKCPCLATHYCDKECQKKDRKTHQGLCTHWLLKDIEKKKHELQVLEADSKCRAREWKQSRRGWLTTTSLWASSCVALCYRAEFQAVDEASSQAGSSCEAGRAVSRRGNFCGQLDWHTYGSWPTLQSVVQIGPGNAGV